MEKGKLLPIGREVKIVEDTVSHYLEIGETYKIHKHSSWGTYLIEDELGDLRAVPVDNTTPVPHRSFWTVLKSLIEQTPTAI